MIEMGMEMGSQECYRWTFTGLVVAFMELALAYLLLCGSAFVFLASEFLLVFGLNIPCPCSGILGYKNSGICLRKLLFEWPMRKIYSIQGLARNRMPSDIVWCRDQEEVLSSATVIANGKHGNGNLKMGSGSASSLRIKNSGDKESDLDARTRHSMNQKQKVTGRRRRGKMSMVFLRGDAPLALADASGASDRSQVMKIGNNEVSGVLDNVIGDEMNLQGPTNCGDKANGTDGETDERGKDSSSGFDVMHSDVDAVEKLEQALLEERAARAALAVELEEERAAAATAADEAVAMILRLQADKASLEMEAKQLERMMEERFAYDEEELTVLKEVLVRRERENHFLEKELEVYKQISFPDDEFAEDGLDEHDYRLGDCDFVTAASAEISQDDMSTCQRVQTRDSVEKGFSSHDAVAEKNEEAEARMNNHKDASSLPDTEPDIYDVHVVEVKTEFRKDKAREHKENEGSVNSVDYIDKETDRTKLVEELVNQLREILKDHDNVSWTSSSAVNGEHK